MSSFILRVLAFVFMTADNVGLALFPRAEIFRAAGRLAFPLYCFLLVCGFRHTRNRKRYAMRLLALSLICEIPFDLLHFAKPFEPLIQNAGWSLLLSLCMLCLYERFSVHPLRYAIPAASALIAMALGLSFGWLGPVMCFVFSRFHSRGSRAACCFALPLLYCLTLMISGVDAGWIRISLAAPAAALPVYFYNGKPGPTGPCIRLLFYLAVPATLLLLLFLRGMRIIPPWTF